MLYQAGARYEVVDAESARVLRKGSADASVREPFETARYPGDPGALILSRGERRYFRDPPHAVPDAAMLDRLAGELASDLAGHVLGDVESLIP